MLHRTRPRARSFGSEAPFAFRSETDATTQTEKDKKKEGGRRVDLTRQMRNHLKNVLEIPSFRRGREADVAFTSRYLHVRRHRSANRVAPARLTVSNREFSLALRNFARGHAGYTRRLYIAG